MQIVFLFVFARGTEFSRPPERWKDSSDKERCERFLSQYKGST